MLSHSSYSSFVRARLALSAIDVVTISWINACPSLPSSPPLEFSNSTSTSSIGGGAHGTSGVVIVVVNGAASAAST
jgi:hypothetical protein